MATAIERPMLNRIIQFSLRNRLVVLVMAVLLMMAGLYTSTQMDVDVFPDLNAPTVVVMTEASGMAPEEVERQVTFPIETAVNGATGVRRVRSTSTTGFSIVWVEFDWGTDVYHARQTVAEKTSLIADELPKGVGRPTLGPQSSILGEVMFVALTADSTSQQDLRTLADWTIRPRLLATGGVAQVSVIGGEKKAYQILLNPDRMRQYGVGLQECIEAVDAMNRNASGGILNEYGNEYIVRGEMATNDTIAIGHAPVKMNGNKPVVLFDIARVGVGNETPKTGVASVNGQNAVVITVTKQPNTSTLELTSKLDRTLKELQQELPSDVRLSTDIYRQERFINSSIDNVKKSLCEGGLFVVIVLFLFLMNVRTTIISLVTIPLSLLAAVLALHATGHTINTMSLGGLAIAIGSLIDDAIVDVENVFKRLRENEALPLSLQRPKIAVIYNASKEVRLPILNSTLIIVMSFLPLFFLSGMEGRMLKPLGIAFIMALAASTLVALTLTPVLCSYVLEGKRKGEALREPVVALRLKSAYTGILKWSLRHGRPVLIVSGCALILALALFATMGRSFLPPFNEGSFTINVSTLPGVSLEESNALGMRAEQALLCIPEIKTVGRKTGRAELDEHALGVNTSEIEAPFELTDRPKEEVVEEIRHKLSDIPGVNIEVGSPITHRIDAMLSGTRASIAIKIFGDDLNRMYRLGQDIKETIQDVEGVADLNVEQQVERPQLKITPRRTMLLNYGMTIPEFSRAVNVLLSGETVSQVYEGERTFNLIMKAEDSFRHSAEGIGNLCMDTRSGKIPLSELADITVSAGPNTIGRENVARKVVVSANVSGRDIGSVVGEIREKVEKNIDMPEGYHIDYGGQFESEQKASRTLFVASAFALLAIFMLLYNQFRSIRLSSIIMVNLPLALIGGVVAVALSGNVVSIPSIIGFISLFGIATRNGMLLVERYNELMKQDLSLTRSILQGSLDRLNPILMTALTTALALIPLIAGGDLPGNEIQSPMAKVILGGLFTSTLLNGIVIPIIYAAVQQRRRRRAQSINK